MTKWGHAILTEDRQAVGNGQGKYADLDWGKMLGKVKDEGFEQTVYLKMGREKLQVGLHLQKMSGDIVEKRLKKYKAKQDNQPGHGRKY